MKEYGNMEERLSGGREDYEKIPVPEEMREKLEAGIDRALAEKEEMRMADREKRISENRKKQNMGKKNRGKITGFRIAAAVAAAAALVVILPNTGADVAHAMGSIPVVGKLFQAVTFRDYQYESDRFDADVEVPQIVVGESEKEAEVQEGAGTKHNTAADQSGGP